MSCHKTAVSVDSLLLGVIVIEWQVMLHLTQVPADLQIRQNETCLLLIWECICCSLFLFSKMFTFFGIHGFGSAIKTWRTVPIYTLIINIMVFVICCHCCFNCPMLYAGSWRSFVHTWMWTRHLRRCWTAVRRQWRVEIVLKIVLLSKKRFYSRRMHMDWLHISCGVYGPSSSLRSPPSSSLILYVHDSVSWYWQ